MKKIIIGGIVAGLIIFTWQTLSWTMLNLHADNQQYTPKQDSILAYLGSQLPGEGGYYLPMAPEGSSFEEMEQLTKNAIGKPWAQVYYHKALEYNMTANILRGLLTDIVLMCLFCWILSKFKTAGFVTTFLACLFTGLIVFSNSLYTVHIWYELFDLNAHLTDYLVSWGAAGIWLGWWMNRGK